MIALDVVDGSVNENDVMMIYEVLFIVLWSRWMKVIKNWKKRNVNDGGKICLHILFSVVLMDVVVITYGIESNPM